jgi:hypothetical protein
VDVDKFETRNPRPHSLSYSSIFHAILNSVIGTGSSSSLVILAYKLIEGTGIFDLLALVSNRISQSPRLAGALVSIVSILTCAVLCLSVSRSVAFLPRASITVQSANPRTEGLAALSRETANVSST